MDNSISEVPEQLEAGERGVKTRLDRSACKAAVKAGSLTLEEAFAEPSMQTALAYDLVVSLPGIGEAKAWSLMQEVGIHPSRRVKGVGTAQRAKLVQAYADWEQKRQERRSSR